jgi:hypothetical protein
MTLPTHEIIRRFQMHVLPKDFRHCGPLASGNWITNIAPVRQLFAVPVRSAGNRLHLYAAMRVANVG